MATRPGWRNCAAVKLNGLARHAFLESTTLAMVDEFDTDTLDSIGAAGASAILKNSVEPKIEIDYGD
jgi:hypothetical protein